MKFNNILVILNPENEKQYALARAVRLVKEQKSHQKVRITVFLSVYDLSYEMSALLSSEERAEMHQGVIEQRTLAIQPYLEKYAIQISNLKLKWYGIAMKQKPLLTKSKSMNMILSSSIRKKKKVLPP